MTPSSYNLPGPRRFGLWPKVAVAIVAGWPVVIQLFALLLLVIARIELGRWPHRFGMDDPKGIPIVSHLQLPLLVLLLLLPVSFVACLVLVVTALYRRAWVWAIAIGGGWLVGFTFMRADIAYVWTWIRD